MTRIEDARAAVDAGAAAVGFVFWPRSPRFIDPAQAQDIVDALPPSTLKVGVFVNQSIEEVNDVADRVGLSVVQLHGDETPEFAAAMTRPVVKAVSLAARSQTMAAWPGDVTLLVDTHDPIIRGGTGRVADWTAAAALAKERRVWLAGGLTAANVADAIARVRPVGIDVSSGVESAPGVKDRRLIRALFDAVEGLESR